MSSAAQIPSTADTQPGARQSPSPPPPTTSAAPGPRAAALQNAFARALEATLNKVSYDNFAACFPTAAKNKPDTLRDFWKSFVGKLGEVCQKHFEDILAEREVVPSLNALDNLVADAKRRKDAAEAQARESGGPVEAPVPPHTLPPSDLLTAHLSPFLHDQQALLTSSLATVEQQTVQLGAVIEEQRAEIEQLVAGLEAMVQDIEKAAGMVQDPSVMDGLGGEVREMEAQLRAG